MTDREATSRPATAGRRDAPAEAADAERETGPERRCLVTGVVQPKDRLIRFVLGPDDEIVPDLAERLPGRGYWVAADRTALDRAARKGLFSRAARRPVRVPEDLVDRMVALMRTRCLGLVGLARRGGATAVGFEKVRALVSDGRAGVLLEASDGAADGRDRLLRLAEARARGGGAGGGRGPVVVARFTRAELGEAVGRDDAVHVAVAAGGLAEALAREATRLDGLDPRPAGTQPEAGPQGNMDASTTGRRTR